MVKLEAHVVGERIIVNLPGARFTMTFEKDPDGPGIVERSHWTRDDPESDIAPQVFRASNLEFARWYRERYLQHYREQPKKAEKRPDARLRRPQVSNGRQR